MGQPDLEIRGSDLVIIVITAVFFGIFAMGLASTCYRWTNNQFPADQFTSSDDETQTMSPRRTGVDAAIVKTFPTSLYSEMKERRIGKGGVECAVCLCEFEDDETLRLMPNCGHVFHVDCVDVWLSDHSTCPLCRVDLVFQQGQRSDLILNIDSVLDSIYLDSVTWSNRYRPTRSSSTRLSNRQVSERLLPRSHSTGHCVENLDQFTLKLPEEAPRQLNEKEVCCLGLTHARSLQRNYRSKSVGSEWSVISYQQNDYNDRRLHSMTFSFTDCLGSNSGRVHAVAPSRTMSLPRTIDSARSFDLFEPDHKV